ncbi:hypothetical protein CFAM422_011712 [Trichoderma lentiforme]|uniref:Uncharacterized protein n=1 Tax=Trichoderma lentiforme TaxID=1567552 RepID=A0A9P4X691_9HYPO|nr:hypothetical protein CFAM422_011712 [Trichoderma lentiforme]
MAFSDSSDDNLPDTAPLPPSLQLDASLVPTQMQANIIHDVDITQGTTQGTTQNTAPRSSEMAISATPSSNTAPPSISASLRRQAGESFQTWGVRVKLIVSQEALGCDLSQSEARKLLGVPDLSRTYEAQVGKWTEDIKTLFCEFEVTCRTLYLVSFNRDHEDLALSFHFEKLSDKWREYCFLYGHKKFQRLANTWKCRTLSNFRAFIEQTAASNKAFRKLDKPSSCQFWFKKNYSPEAFVDIFNFCNKNINIKRSKKAMPKYATREDGLYRAFQKACDKGVEDPTKAPKLHEYMGALMCCPGHTEAKLGKAWTAFETARPEIAQALRVNCLGFAMIDGEQFHPAPVEGYSKPRHLLRVSNPNYLSGKPLGGDGARTIAEKKQKVVKRKRDAKVAEDEGISDIDDVALGDKRQKQNHDEESLEMEFNPYPESEKEDVEEDEGIGADGEKNDDGIPNSFTDLLADNGIYE